MVAGTGMSQNPSASVAAQEAVTMAMQKLGGQPPSLALVFSSIQFNQELLITELARHLPPTTQLVGCSDAGEITELGPQKKSVAIMLLATPGITVATAASALITADAKDTSRMAGKIVTQQLIQLLGGDPTVLCLLSDGLIGDGSEMMHGVTDVMPQRHGLIGGAAGDDFYFRKTYQYFRNEVRSSHLLGIGLRGAVKVGVAQAHGWRNLGITKQITKAKGNVIYEIDGQPAVNFYEEYFGKDNVDKLRRESLARLAITYPLGIAVTDPQGVRTWLVRCPLSVDEQGALHCGAAIPNNTTVDLMIGGHEEVLQAAKTATQSAMSQLSGAAPKAVIVFSSIARSRLLGFHASDELQAIVDAVGKGVPIIGCNTYAEFGPDFSYQNESIAVMILGEA